MNLPFFNWINKYLNFKPMEVEFEHSAIIRRFSHESKQTLGNLFLFDDDRLLLECKTLELPWFNNATQKSCIPVGEYKVVPRTSAKFKKHFHVLDVPNRSYILIHAGNYYWDILGCILVGDSHIDINKDGFRDVTNSKITLNKLLVLSPNGFNLTIENE